MTSFTTKTITWEGKQVQVLMPRPTEPQTKSKNKFHALSMILIFVAMFATLLSVNYQPQTQAKTTGQIASGIIEYRN